MPQPVRKDTKNVPKKKVTSKKNTTGDSRLPTNENIKARKKWSPFRKNTKKHPAYGTSKLEVRFQKEFLDRLGLKYIYQYEIKSIGRFLDYMIVDNVEHPSYMVALEVQGDRYHGFEMMYEQMNPMQKRSYWADGAKKDWCLRNGIPILYIWEHDINKKPDEVLKYLEKELGAFIDGTYKEKKKRH